MQLIGTLSSERCPLRTRSCVELKVGLFLAALRPSDQPEHGEVGGCGIYHEARFNVAETKSTGFEAQQAARSECDHSGHAQAVHRASFETVMLAMRGKGHV